MEFNNMKLIFGSDIQDIYEFASGIRLVVNKFTVDEDYYGRHSFAAHMIEHVKHSYQLTEITQNYYSTQKNKNYKAGTKLYKLCPVIPTDNVDEWGFNLISRETTLTYSEMTKTIMQLIGITEKISNITKINEDMLEAV